MRVIILSIAFLFLAFSAQSQVLKSAGVWYFLDVDSMTARPAVLPNGTELAYVVGTKTVYYWNRATSTWTAYGSTFNRDSIYFDSSIAGSGTVGDPWRVDSTLFATIAAVGDSIVAALGYVAANYFPLEGGTLTGTGGAGFIGFPSQVSAPGTPASGLNVYAQGSSFNWKGTDGYERLFASTLTGGRTYTLPDVSGTFALGTGTADRLARWTGTNTLAAGNLSDNATRLEALLPWQFHSWTTAGRPTGVNGYVGRNSTTGFQEGYFTSQWENYITSIGASNGQLAIFSSAGKIYGTNNLFWNNGETRLGIGTASPNQALEINRNTDNPVVALIENANSGGSSEAVFMAKSSAGVTQVGKRGPGYSPYKNIGPNDSYVYSNSGNFAFLVDGSGNISFSAGGSSTAQMTLAATGNLLLGTTTDVPTSILTARSTTKSSSPFPLHTLAESDAITGVQGNFDYETTQNGLRWYNGTRKAYALESTAARFTAGSLIFADANGQATQNNANLSYISANGALLLGGYGAGTKEAADLSKTQSNYLAGFATDGTLLDMPINTELYNTITSTTSPQTLSSTRADNLINQGGTQATFTFRLPASPVDGQISKATFANAVTVLTIDGNGTTVTGTLPTTVNIGQQIIFKNYTGLGWVRQL